MKTVARETGRMTYARGAPAISLLEYLSSFSLLSVINGQEMTYFGLDNKKNTAYIRLLLQFPSVKMNHL